MRVFFKILFIKYFIYLFLGREKERERETSVCDCLSCIPYWGAGLPGMCLDWESNQQPLGSQAGTLSTEPHQPGQCGVFCDVGTPGKIMDQAQDC